MTQLPGKIQFRAMDRFQDKITPELNEEARSVLEANRLLILHNVVPADETYDSFAAAKLLPKFYIDGIKVGICLLLL